MAEVTYDWIRFWTPSGEPLNSASDHGYLANPMSELRQFLHPHLVQLADLADVPCLVLLGEQGLGKSHTLCAEADRIRCEVAGSNDRVVLVDLRKIVGENSLDRELLRNESIEQWKAGSGLLFLFIDSFDEGMRGFERLPAALAHEFRDYDLSRLRLRVACRSGSWPDALTSTLEGMWSAASVQTCVLLSLRREDVAAAARADGVDPEAFLAAVESSGVPTLAGRPFTLRMLLAEYRKSGNLSSTQLELFRRGVRALCQDAADDSRPASARAVPVGHRLAVAERIAALTTFGRRTIVQTADPFDNDPESDLQLHEVAGGNEVVDGTEFVISEPVVGLTLETAGLFSSQGRNRLGWAHSSFAEFLAASYLDRRSLTLPQLLNLFVHPDDPAQRLAPQLHGVAAWLCAMNADFRDEVLRRDPEALLNAEVQLPEAARSDLVAALLLLHESGEWNDRAKTARRTYPLLAHAHIAEQLRPCIRGEATSHENARQCAIDLAESNRLTELLLDLLDVVLDPAQPLRVRINAAWVVYELGDDDARARLRPLALQPEAGDPLRQLQGVALKAVWPKHLAPDEVFATLEPPSEHSLGIYEQFLSGDLVEKLPSHGLSVALRWACSQMTGGRRLFSLDRLIDNTLISAADHLDDPLIAEAFVDPAFEWLRQGGPFSDEARSWTRSPGPLEDAERRRRILTALAPAVSDDDQFAELSDIALSADTIWMVHQLSGSSGAVRRTWARLVADKFDMTSFSDVEAVLEVFHADSAQAAERDVLAPHLQAIDIVSDEAERCRQRYQKHEEFKVKWAQRASAETSMPLVPARVEKHLAEFESGVYEAWRELILDLLTDDSGRLTHHQLTPDLTRLPGWDLVDANTHLRLRRAAETFVGSHEPRTSEVIGMRRHFPLDYAGYQALELLWRTEKASLAMLEATAWEKWVPVIVSFPVVEAEHRDAQRHLTRLAYDSAPNALIRALLLLIERDPERTESYLRTVDDCLDGRIGSALLDKAREATLTPHQVGVILEKLLENGVPGAQGFAESLIASAPSSDDDAETRAEVSARVLLTHAEDAGWSIVWPALQNRPEPFAERVLGSVAREDWEAAATCSRLSCDDMADLYLWLACRFPHADDPNSVGGHFETNRERIGEWRDAVLSQLRHRGTQDAANAMLRIALALPQLDWLKRLATEASYLWRHQSWRPFDPQTILALTRDARLRVVQNSDQLLDVVLESLARLEDRLQRQSPPLAPYLWDERDGWRPKDENRLTDFVKAHLDGDLGGRRIVFNREVENRRGERQDILVQCFAPDNPAESNPPSVVIEVKGCWNRGLNEEMRTQLHDAYLASTPGARGVYLVGWYNRQQWDNDHYQRDDAPKWSLQEARQVFAGQAAALSVDDPRIAAFVLDTSIPTNWRAAKNTEPLEPASAATQNPRLTG